MQNCFSIKCFKRIHHYIQRIETIRYLSFLLPTVSAFCIPPVRFLNISEQKYEALISGNKREVSHGHLSVGQTCVHKIPKSNNVVYWALTRKSNTWIHVESSCLITSIMSSSIQLFTLFAFFFALALIK